MEGFGTVPKAVPHHGVWDRQWQGQESPHGSVWSCFVHYSIKKSGICCSSPREFWICSRGSPKLLPRCLHGGDPKPWIPWIPMPRVGDPITSALLPGKIPSGLIHEPTPLLLDSNPGFKAPGGFSTQKILTFSSLPAPSALSGAELLPCRQSRI